jgi:hypothetical protein
LGRKLDEKDYQSLNQKEEESLKIYVPKNQFLDSII